jgi:GNAT superfamily N-acetyltransferase
MELRAPLPSEAGLLTDLCLRSKAVWGYDADFMEACRGELTMTPADLARSQMRVATEGGRIVGVAQLVQQGRVAEIEKLFVDPAHLKCGAGRALFAWCVDTARGSGAVALTVVSDPGAAGFYRKMGMTEEGKVPSGSIAGRMLPKYWMGLG